MDNDANAAAQAELWFGRPEIREVRDFILVLVEGGVGTGIVFDGQVYRGENGAAGEFGHMTIGRERRSLALQVVVSVGKLLLPNVRRSRAIRIFQADETALRVQISATLIDLALTQ